MEALRNVLVPKRLWVIRGLVPNRLDAETSVAEISSYQNALVPKSQLIFGHESLPPSGFGLIT